MNKFDTSTIHLRQGQSLWTSVRRGTYIVVSQGRVRVDGPGVWMSETLVTLGIHLQEGQVHVVEHHGWIELAASSDASLLQSAPRSSVFLALNALWEQTGRWLGRSEVGPAASPALPRQTAVWPGAGA